MISLLIHQAVDSIQIIYPKLRNLNFTMANNFIQEIQQSQDSLDPPAEPSTIDFSDKSLITDIIGQSLDSLTNQTEDPVDAPEKESKRISLRTLVRLVIMLNRAVKPNADLNYWRNLAQSRGEMSSRYSQVIEIQRKRIETLEHDLRTLIGLARETREMLAEIAEEKQANQDRGDGEFPH